MKKDEIRARVRARKAMLDDIERTEAAARVFDTLASMAAFTMARKVLMYHSLPDELGTHAFLDRWESDKEFYLPRVNGLDLEILPYSRTRTHLGAFHIEEPDGEDTADVSDMDLIIVPAVAYDRSGNRVGRGKGYYDRLLGRSKALKIGVCYDFQLFDEDEIEAEEHDVAVDFIITDRHGIIRIKH
ncbi:MAG: 5-formyltetrahydrofolate cyclo-ligase [Bacteroidales bacterium]|nr:5-formyltetrahydrofolate cyclo-ligase [Bacteroidales bacterium]